MALIKSASVKVMLSHDYCHFESSMVIEDEDGITVEDIDSARKNCQRLSNKAVEQYKTYNKLQAIKRSDGKYKMENFEAQCKAIAAKSENDRTLNEIAMLKQYKNEKWQEQFDYNYDFDDDDNYNF